MRDLLWNTITAQRDAALGKDHFVLVRDLSIDIGFDRAGTDGIAGDPITPQVIRHRPGESDYAMFGSDIGTIARCRAEALG